MPVGTGSDVVTAAAVASGPGASVLPMKPKLAHLKGSALPPVLVPSSFLHLLAASPRAVRQSPRLNLTSPCLQLSLAAILDQSSTHTPAWLS